MQHTAHAGGYVNMAWHAGPSCSGGDFILKKNG